MKIIKDIRLYKSEAQNEYGKPITYSFADKKLNAVTQRIVMKLREYGFSLGDFDHLYINFTTCSMSEKISLSKEVDRYHPWYRYCSVNIEKELYDKLGSSDTYADIISVIKKILITYFVTEDFGQTLILSCVSQAVEQGENMLMKFKEKIGTKRKAVIFLRYLDRCIYYPLLQIYDMDENLLFEKNLPETLMLDYLGDIQISAKRVTIKPRKNALTAQKEAMVFEY